MCKTAFHELADELAMRMFQEGKDKGFDFEDIANFIGGKKSSVRHYYYGETTPSLAVFIGAWKRIKPLKALKRLADWSNAVVFKLPDLPKGSHLILMKQTSDVMKETADVVNKVAESLEDNDFRDHEKLDTIKEIDEAIEALAILRNKVKDDLTEGL